MTRRRYGLGERALAVALAVAVVLLAGAMVVPARVLDYLAAEEEIDGLRARYVELARRQRDLGVLESILDELKATDPQAYGLLVAETTDLALADIQNRMQRIAAGEEATLAQFRAIEAAEENRVEAQVSLRIPMAGLPGFLVRIGASRPPLFVDSLAIGAGRMNRLAEAPPDLIVEMTLSSFVAIGAGKEGR